MKKYNVILIVLVSISASAMDLLKPNGSGESQSATRDEGYRIYRSLIKHASTEQSVWVHVPTINSILSDLKPCEENNSKIKTIYRLFTKKTDVKESLKDVPFKKIDPNGKDWQLVSPKEIIDLFLKRAYGQEFFIRYYKEAPTVPGGFIDLNYFYKQFVKLNTHCYEDRIEDCLPLPNIMISSKGVISAEENANEIYNLAETCGYKTVSNK